jgi:hypothetical protein
MFYSYKNGRILIDGKEILANDIAFSLASNPESHYFIENKNSNSFVPGNGVNGSLRLNYYFTGNDPLKTYLIEENKNISGNFGGLYFKSGYLTSYTIDATPNAPVNISTEIVFFDALSGNFSPTYSKEINGEPFNFSDAKITYGPGSSVAQSSIIALNYNYMCEATPSYLIGEALPARVVRGKKESSLTLTNDSLSSDLSIYGDYAAIRLKLVHSQNTGIYQEFDVNGVVYQKNLATSTNDILKNSVTIKQTNFDYSKFKSNLENNLFAVAPINTASYNAPVIYFAEPTTGYYGTVISISGKYLSSVDSIYYANGVSDNTFSIVNDNLILSIIPSGAGDGGFTVYSSAGGSDISEDIKIGGLDIKINSFSYPTGKIGERIKIYGENFFNIDTVKFGNVLADFDLYSSTIIDAVVPTGVTYNSVSVVSSAFEKTGVSSYYFSPFPKISNIYPLSGISGQMIVISGDGFNGVTGVKVNNLPANNSALFSLIDNTGIQLYIPSGNTRGTINLYGYSGVATASDDSFYPMAVPTGLTAISGFEGDSVLISGNNFFPEILYQTETNKYGVIFNTATGSFSRLSNLLLSGIVPSGATSGNVKILNENGYEYPSSLSFNVRHGPPYVSGVVPISGKAADYLSIYGGNFIDVTGILVTGNLGGSYISAANYSVSYYEDFINFELPQITGGAYDVVVYTREGTGRYSSFNVLNKPIVSGFSPSIAGIGSEITVTGQYFYPGLTNVYINITGNDVAKCSINESGFNEYNTQLKFFVPVEISGGNLNTIYVENTAGISSGNYNFYYIPQPNVQTFSSTTGQWGQYVSISGANFDRVTGVTIGNVYNQFTQIDTTGITFLINTGTKTDFVTVYTSGGADIYNNPFIVIPPPVIIDSFYPTEGYYGTSLRISGLYMDTVRSISFSGSVTGQEISTSLFSTIGGTGLYVTIPQFVSGDNKIKIVNDNTTVYSSSLLSIIRSPIVNYYNLTSGIYGQQIYISGENLSGASPLFLAATGDYAYISGNNTFYVENTGLYTNIPSQILTSQIFVSGRNGVLVTGYNSFVPLPTIFGIESNVYPTGGTIKISGYNVFNTQAFIGMSGVDNVFRNVANIEPNWTFDSSLATGNNGLSTGIGIIYAKLTEYYPGSGRIFLAAADDDVSNISGSISYSFKNSITYSSYLNITDATPTFGGFYNYKGNSNTFINITGAGLASTTGIKFNNGITSAYGTIASTSPYSIYVYPPASIATGSGIINLYTRYGSANSTNNFTFIPSLYISGASPMNGFTGDLITITGSGMSSVTGVYFGAYNAQFTSNPSRNSFEISGWIPNEYKFSSPQYINISIYNEVGSYTMTGFNLNGAIGNMAFGNVTTAPLDLLNVDRWIEVKLSGVAYKMPLFA